MTASFASLTYEGRATQPQPGDRLEMWTHISLGAPTFHTARFSRNGVALRRDDADDKIIFYCEIIDFLELLLLHSPAQSYVRILQDENKTVYELRGTLPSLLVLTKEHLENIGWRDVSFEPKDVTRIVSPTGVACEFRAGFWGVDPDTQQKRRVTESELYAPQD